MLSRIDNVTVRGIVSCVPCHIEENDVYIDALGEKRIRKQTRMTGVHRRRISGSGQMASDFCIIASKDLISSINWDARDIRFLIYITQSPDFETPSTAFRIRKELELPTDAVVFDVNLGCTGYVSGLYFISSLLSMQPIGTKGLLLTGEIQRRPWNAPPNTEEDFADQMLFGDAGAATALEVTGETVKSCFSVFSDGDNYEVIHRAHGGYDKMNGEVVFEYAMREVSSRSVNHESFCRKNGLVPDYYVFHQANRFMIANLAAILEMPEDRLLFSIEEFGNTSSASIPLTICYNKTVHAGGTVYYLCGFGIGLSSAFATIRLPEDVYLNLIESDDRCGGLIT